MIELRLCTDGSIKFHGGSGNNNRTAGHHYQSRSKATSGSVSVGTSTLFSAAPQQVGNLAAGASTTIKVPLTISSTAYGKQTLQLQFTSSNGKTSQATVSAQISGKETTGITVSGQRTNTSRDLATNPYAVGEKVPYSFRVTSIGNIAQWIVPTEGNFAPFAANPVGEPNPTGNCRYSNLPAGSAYTCATPRHEVTSQDLANGYFIPQTHWTIGRIGNNTVVNQYTITGEEVDLVDRQPSFTAEATSPAKVATAANPSEQAGDWMSYEVTVTNTGNVRLSDIEGPGFEFDALEPGESRSKTVRRLKTSLDASEVKVQSLGKLASARNGENSIQSEVKAAPSR